MATVAERSALWGAKARPEFDRVVQRTAAGLRAAFALLTLVGDEQQYSLARTRAPPPYGVERFVPLGFSLCQHVVAMDRPLVVDDAWLNPLVREASAVTEGGLGAYLGAPIHDEAGATLGALCAVELAPRRWTARERDFVVTMAGHAERLIRGMRWG